MNHPNRQPIWHLHSPLLQPEELIELTVWLLRECLNFALAFGLWGIPRFRAPSITRRFKVAMPGLYCQKEVAAVPPVAP
jgi:hypothetical protein